MKAAILVLAGLLVLLPVVSAHSGLPLSVPATAARSYNLQIGAAPGHSGGVLDLLGDHGDPRAFVEPSTNPTAFGAAGDGYAFQFKCPDVQANAANVLGCPLYIQDPEDIMTQPVMVIDPRDPSMIAFHALHGGYGAHPPIGDQPPAPDARDDVLHQPHTVFQTQKGGATWLDQRYYSPYKGVQEGQLFPTSEYDQVYGVDNAMTLDGQRNMVIGSTYAYRDNGEPAFHNVVFLWKAKQINYPFETSSGQTALQPDAAGNQIDNLHLTYVKESDRLVAMWRESVPGSATSVPAAGAPSSWIQFATMQGGEGGAWNKTTKEGAIGPCADISTPVPFNGLVYVACSPAADYVAPAGFEPRFIQIYAFDPVHATNAHMAQVAITAGHPVLAKLAYDEMALVAAGKQGENVFVKVAIGVPTDPVWTRVSDIYEKIRNQNVTGASTAPVVDARVTAVGMAPESHYIHIIYEEKYDRSGGSSPVVTNYGAPEIFKSMGALDAKGRWVSGMDLKVGDVQTRMHFDPQYQGVGDGIFWDAHDSFVMFTDKTGAHREFVAFGDYGYARMAEITEDNFVPVIGGLPAAPPAIPAATPGVDPATTGALAGALAGALSLRVLSARRKSKVEAPSL